jgi:hypothetical protein
VRTGTVDFSTTIFGVRDTLAMVRAHDSRYLRSAARPAPMPNVFVGVFTDTKMMSAASISASTSVEKNKFLRDRGGSDSDGTKSVSARRCTFQPHNAPARQTQRPRRAAIPQRI